MDRPRFTGMPAFTIIWLGQVMSLIGTALFSFAIGIWLYQQTGLATTITTMIFFSNIPRIVLSPFAGALVDRWNRKLTMLLSDLASGFTTMLVLGLMWSGSDDLGETDAEIEQALDDIRDSIKELQYYREHFIRTKKP